MSALNQKTIAALRAEMIEAEAAATNPPIYSAAFLATLVKQFSAMLAKHQGTITEANAEIDRLKSENAFLKSEIQSYTDKKVKNVGDDLIDSIAVKAQVNAEVIDDSDSDSDSDVIEVNCVVYNGITYHREVNSNVLYHPKKHEVVGMWNDGRGRVDVLPINPHED